MVAVSLQQRYNTIHADKPAVDSMSLVFTGNEGNGCIGFLDGITRN